MISGRGRGLGGRVWRLATRRRGSLLATELKSLRFHRRPYNPWSHDFTQKLLRYGRSDWIEGQHVLADKLLVRDWVAERAGAGYLTEVYAVADSFDELLEADLPERFFLKTNHGSGYNLPCPRRDELDVAAARERFTDHLARNFADVGGERQYRRITPRVYAEELLDLDQPRSAMMRCFAFDGQVAVIVVDTASDRLAPLEQSIYLPDWTPAPFEIGAPRGDASFPRPHNLDELIGVAEKLSSGIPFVRVDLYWLDGRIVFSELTLTPSAGHRRILPKAHDRALGDLFELPR